MEYQLKKRRQEEKEWWDKFSSIVAYQCKLNPYLNKIVHTQLIEDYTEFLYKKDGRLLDIGCGHGSVSVHFAKLGMDVTGIDFSTEQIKQANKMKKEYKLENINLLCRDITNIDYDEFHEYFDSIMIYAVLHHLADVEIIEIISKLDKLLKRGGKIYIYEPLIESREVHGKITFSTLIYLLIGIILYSIYGLHRICNMRTKEYLGARKNGYTGGSPYEAPVALPIIFRNIPNGIIIKEIKPWHLFSLMYAMKMMFLKSPYQKLFMKFCKPVYLLDKVLFKIFSWKNIHNRFPLLCGIKLEKIR